MLNTFVLVGTITEVIKDGNFHTEMIVRCDRSFREEDGMSVQDCFRVKIWKGLADEIGSIAKEGKLAAVKGRMRMEEGEIKLIGEHVSLYRG